MCLDIQTITKQLQVLLQVPWNYSYNFKQAEMAVGEIFIVNANGSDYVFKCKSVSLNSIVCEPKTGFQSITTAVGFVRRLVTSRVSDIAEINQRIVDQGLKDDEKFWVDQSNDGKWKIVNNRFVSKQHDTVSQQQIQVM